MSDLMSLIINKYFLKRKHLTVFCGTSSYMYDVDCSSILMIRCCPVVHCGLVITGISSYLKLACRDAKIQSEMKTVTV